MGGLAAVVVAALAALTACGTAGASGTLAGNWTAAVAEWNSSGVVVVSGALTAGVLNATGNPLVLGGGRQT